MNFFKIKITNDVKDIAGNVLSEQWIQNNGFTVSAYYLPDTGQTQSYTTTFGEDSDYLINAPSYTDNGNGTVTDNNTGLIWQDEDDGTVRNWTAAVTYCSDLSLGGSSNWRVPELQEFINIMYYPTSSPRVNTTYFTLEDSYYWSNTARASSSTTYAWSVSTTYGTAGYNTKSGVRYVLCVR